MKRMAACLFAGVFAVLGCVSEQGRIGSQYLNGVPIKTPDPVKASPAYLKTAERVETLGQRIVEQNTFVGITPMFHILGVPESVLFHRGPDELFISEGLANHCKSESLLAAVLCSEMGRMKAEKLSAKDAGVHLQSVQETPEPNPLGEGEVAGLATGANDSNATKSRALSATSAEQFAREFLSGAGFEASELDAVKTLLAGVKRDESWGKQMAGPSPAPRWQP